MNIFVKLPPASPMPSAPNPKPASQFLEQDAFPAGTSPTTRPRSRGNQLEKTVCLEQLQVEAALICCMTVVALSNGDNGIEMGPKKRLLRMLLL